MNYLDLVKMAMQIWRMSGNTVKFPATDFIINNASLAADGDALGFNANKLYYVTLANFTILGGVNDVANYWRVQLKNKLNLNNNLSYSYAWPKGVEGASAASVAAQYTLKDFFTFGIRLDEVLAPSNIEYNVSHIEFDFT